MGSAQYLDPYDFDNDDYVESQESGLDSSLLELLRQGSCSSSSSDEEEFSGFTREQIYLSRKTQRHTIRKFVFRENNFYQLIDSSRSISL